MSEIKKVCWNCLHCDTFGGICFKGKFDNAPVKIYLDNYSCEYFDCSDKSAYSRISAKVRQLQAENERLLERLEISPQGDDKIDELETAIEFYKTDIRGLKDALEGSRIIVNIAQQEVERLKQENEDYKAISNIVSVKILEEAIEEASEVIEARELEIEQLKQAVAEREEALRKCNPYHPSEHGFSDCDKCIYCNEYYDLGHKDNCQYVRLCGGAV